VIAAEEVRFAFWGLLGQNSCYITGRERRVSVDARFRLGHIGDGYELSFVPMCIDVTNRALLCWTGVLCCIRALGGYTIASSVDTVFDTDQFREKDYYDHLVKTSGNVALALNW
jgi:hypothetical protein